MSDYLKKKALRQQGLKECKSCKEIKAFAEFYLTGERDGKRFPLPCCKKCDLKQRAEWSRTHRELKNKWAHAWMVKPGVRRQYNAKKEKLRQSLPRFAMQCTLRNGLKRRPTEYPATIDDLMQKWRDQDGRCALTGIEMTWGGQGRRVARPTSISLDRIDPEGGYSANNLRLICQAINAFRGRMSDAEMVEMARILVTKADAKDKRPTWKPYLVHSEAV